MTPDRSVTVRFWLLLFTFSQAFIFLDFHLSSGCPMSAPPSTFCRNHVSISRLVILLHLYSERITFQNPCHVLVNTKSSAGQVDFKTALSAAVFLPRSNLRPNRTQSAPRQLRSSQKYNHPGYKVPIGTLHLV